jgi:hypothetical protein
MATYGTPGSPTYSVSINNLGDMFNVLPDNSANLIDAQDVRDVVAGLYENIESVSASVAGIASASVAYSNSNPTSVQLGGVLFNSTFSSLSIQQLFDTLFYPYTPPSLTFSVAPSVVEYGNISQLTTLSWSVNSGINNVITSQIFRPLDPIQSVATPVAFSLASGTLGSNQILPNQFTIFTFSVDDGTVYSITSSVSYSNRRFWGTLLSSSDLVVASSSVFSYLDLTSLNSELNDGYPQSRTIMTNNDYVVFVWPSNSVNLESFPPKVYINGLPNNDWTKTRDGVIFTNQFGYTASYDVWRFNNIQGSMTSSYVITT